MTQVPLKFRRLFIIEKGCNHLTFIEYSSGCENALEKAYDLDAAYDLKSTETYILMPMERKKFNTGVVIGLPENVVGMVCSRSGLAFNSGIIVLNAPGIVDPGYRGTISVILINLSDKPYSVNSGDNIAQVLFTPVLKTVFRKKEKIENNTDRGSKGFGSSGA